MLYFAYGSNLNHKQMKRIRCIGCSHVKNTYLRNYDLSFCHPNKKNFFGYANVFKKRGSKVPGAIWKINRKHERKLDKYEQFPDAYKKNYFYINSKKVMFYTMEHCCFRKPSKRYINLIKTGYKNCNLDLNYLKERLSKYNIKLK